MGWQILIVDDDEDERDLICAILRDLGHRLETAGDGSEALCKATDLQPDLVILDLMRPGGDGWTVLARLREIPDPPSVVVLSAFLDSRELARARASGAVASLAKPFRFQDLIAVCDLVEPSRRHRSPCLAGE